MANSFTIAGKVTFNHPIRNPLPPPPVWPQFHSHFQLGFHIQWGAANPANPLIKRRVCFVAEWLWPLTRHVQRNCSCVDLTYKTTEAFCHNVTSLCSKTKEWDWKNWGIRKCNLQSISALSMNFREAHVFTLADLSYPGQSVTKLLRNVKWCCGSRSLISPERSQFFYVFYVFGKW